MIFRFFPSFTAETRKIEEKNNAGLDETGECANATMQGSTCDVLVFPLLSRLEPENWKNTATQGSTCEFPALPFIQG